MIKWDFCETLFWLRTAILTWTCLKTSTLPPIVFFNIPLFLFLFFEFTIIRQPNYIYTNNFINKWSFPQVVVSVNERQFRHPVIRPPFLIILIHLDFRHDDLLVALHFQLDLIRRRLRLVFVVQYATKHQDKHHNRAKI